MSVTKRPFTLRIIEEHYAKIQAISDHEHRSMAAQIEYLIQEYIEAYEVKHGPVVVPEKK